MSTYTDYRYSFNGVLSTDKTVMQNLETMCTSAGTWLAYDLHDGKWSVVINKAGSSVASFTASNIIGPITVTGSGLTSLYNKVKVQFPHIDLNDQLDYVQIEIPSGSRNANEPDNTLQMQLDVINDPVQAQIIGGINLKQSRVDKVIHFVTDFSKVGLKGGDLIDVTAGTFGFTNKMFRVTSVTERDADDGSIQLEISALEYDANVYDTSDLTRYAVSNSTGIVTIGAIGVPGTPTIDKVERNARPNITINTTAPTGIVDSIQFWLTSDTGVFYDNDRKYALVGTVKAPVGANFAYGDAVHLSLDNIPSGNFYVKVRGINSTVTGPYSLPTGFIYTPQQITNAIDPNTLAVDATGGLLTSLAVTYLLNHLDDVWKGISDPGSLFDKIFDIFGSTTGNDIRLNVPVGLETFEIGSSRSTIDGLYNSYTSGVVWNTNYPGDADRDNPLKNVRVGFLVETGMKQMLLILQTPLGSFDYDYKDASGSIVTQPALYAYFPSLVRVYKDGVLIQQTTVDWQTQTSIMQVEGAGPGFYEVWHCPLETYDLNQEDVPYIHPYNFSTANQASGNGSTLTAYMFR